MPYWVKNKIEIWGKNISERIEDKFFTAEMTPDGLVKNFDFNKIIPMPKSLDIKSGTLTYEGMKLYLAQINPTIQNFGSIKDKLSLDNFSKRIAAMFMRNKAYSPNYYLLSPSEVDKMIARLDPGTINVCLENGKAGVENTINYGYPTWLEWRNRYWNCNRNATETRYETHDDNYIQIEFSSPWVPPTPVIKALCEQLTKEDELSYSFAGEEAGHYAGYINLSKGEITHFDYNQYSEEAYNTYFDLWGGSDEYYHDKYSGEFIKAHDYISELTEEIGMEWIDKADASKLVDKYCKQEAYEEHELKNFCWMENGKYCAIFNEDGNCWTEEYNTEGFINELIETKDLIDGNKLAEELVKFQYDYDYYGYMDGKEVWESNEDLFNKYVTSTKQDLFENNGESIKKELKEIIEGNEPEPADSKYADYHKLATDLLSKVNKFTSIHPSDKTQLWPKKSTEARSK